MKITRLRLKYKKSIICRNVESNFIRRDLAKVHKPSVGDIGIFRVRTIGKHTRIQLSSGNNSFILPGDYIMAAFGNRYASEQFEGYVPDTYQKEYHILGQGGAIGIVATMHQRFDMIGPTTLSLIGYMCDKEGRLYNTKSIADEKYGTLVLDVDKRNVILSVGSGMDSGKTTTAGFLTHGLKQAGRKIVYIKLTGTVYTRDKRFLKDYGADMVLDFSDFGYPSTFLCPYDELITLFQRLRFVAEKIQPDYLVIEIADGLYQQETRALLNNPLFLKTIRGVLFSSADSISAISGARMLSEKRLNVLGITGLLTTSPLLMKEVQCNSNYQVLTSDQLGNREVADLLNL